MKVIFIIIGVALVGFLAFLTIKHLITKHLLISYFSNGNVIVSGRKGYGKDVLFATLIKWRKDEYFSNLDYGYDYNNINIKQLELSPNDYNNFIKGNIEKVTKNEALEGKDIYISDAGVYLPSQFDSTIQKTYPSLSIFFALNRHLYNNGMHLNAQRLDRIFKSLREQADGFVLMRKRPIKLPFIMILRVTIYDKYDSALQELQPIGSRFFNKYSKAEVDKYHALHGFIKNGLVIVRKGSLKYDSRAFHEILFGVKAPSNKKKKKSSEDLE